MDLDTSKLRFFSETPKYKSLSEDDKQHPLDWHTFARENRSILISMVFGTTCCLIAIGYTAWLSKQLLFKPDWAVDIQIGRVANWNANNLPLCQGFVTIFYAVGLYSIAFAAQAISETALWALHSRKPLSLDQMDTYLLAVRGSIPPMDELLRLCDSLHLALFLIASILIFLTPLAAAPLVGTVWTRIDHPWTFKARYSMGGGIGRMFAQVNPPVSIGAESLASYISWSRSLSDEVLPDLRNWVISRDDLKDLSNFTARAIRLQQRVTCSPFPLTEMPSPGKDIVNFTTHMAEQNYRNRVFNNSASVRIRLAETMAVWADTFDFVSANRSMARLVFAAFNGTIESGISMRLSDDAYWYPTNVSSIACDVDIEFIDDTLVVGRGSPPNTLIPTLSSIGGIHISFLNNTKDMRSSENTLNENALWHAVAPVIVSPSVDGAQPMYYRNKKSKSKSKVSIPIGYTKAAFKTYEDGEPENDWTLAEIKHFINVSSGATALASSQNFRTDHKANPQTIHTVVNTRKLDPERVIYLGIPVIIIVLGEVLLMWWNIMLHRQEGITVVRMARITDILENVRPWSVVELQKMSSIRSAKDGTVTRNSSIKGVKIEVRDQNWGQTRTIDEDLEAEIPTAHDGSVRDGESTLGSVLDRAKSMKTPHTTISTDSQPETLPWDTMAPEDRQEFFQRHSKVFMD